MVLEFARLHYGILGIKLVFSGIIFSMKAGEFTEVLSHNEPMTPLGRLAGAAYIHHKTGYLPWRVLGCYALVYVLSGQGKYEDRTGNVQEVGAGDLILLFPEIAHRYGPGRRQEWSEFYLLFEGPAFDFWREARVLDTARPVTALVPTEEWHARLIACAAEVNGQVKVSSLLTLLTEAAATRQSEEPVTTLLPWLEQARQLLERNLNEDMTAAGAASQLGLSYESFRKAFEQHLGISPARYRAGKRLDAARSLLLHTAMTSRQIADSLGFRDEFYFSKRFKLLTGVSPRVFRRVTRPVSTGE